PLIFPLSLHDALPISQVNFALLRREHARDQVEHGGFARAVAADDGDKVAVFYGDTHALQRLFLIDGADVEDLDDVFQFKHCPALDRKSTRLNSSHVSI